MSVTVRRQKSTEADVVRAFHALSDETRLQIIHLLLADAVWLALVLLAASALADAPAAETVAARPERENQPAAV